jgi:thiamine-phosphate pyrophosphorylase
MAEKEQRMKNVRLQFITHYTDQYNYLDSVRLALEGGCRWIQLRMKDATADEIIRTGLEAADLCHSYGATFLIDDHVELVGRIHADGVHLGKNDMPIAEARHLLGDDCIIGGTANTIDDVRAHYRSGADYIGCGPFRYTTTKKNLSPILGLEGYADIVHHMQQEGISLPIVAIGGITKADIPALMQTGISGIALSGSILRANNPVEEMQSVCRELKMNN